MADRDEAKPVSCAYDFGDDWLDDDLDEALEFDEPEPEIAAEQTAAPEDEQEDAAESGEAGQRDGAAGNGSIAENAGPAEKENGAIDEIEVMLEEPAVLEMDVNLDGVENEPVAGHAVTAQVLDIAALQKSVSASQIDVGVSTGVPADDAQMWQFISLIVMRLLDDLELLIVEKSCDEACDIMKQLHRLANILAFADMDDQLPLLAYVGHMMPVSFTSAPIGEETERRFDASKMRNFIEKGNEILNCSVYLLTYFQHHAPSFDTGRFSDVLESLYVALGATPGQPSNEAPLPGGDDVNPHELTTRTLGKLSRTLEALVSESLHYLESAAFYGYSRGYEDAAKSVDSAAQIVREYHLFDFEPLFREIYKGVRYVRTPNLPGNDVLSCYMQVFELFRQHFSKQMPDEKIQHLETIIAKFSATGNGCIHVPFCGRWQNFMQTALPDLSFECCLSEDLFGRVRVLRSLSLDHGIEWLSDTLSRLETLWPSYPSSCAEAFVALAEEMKAFPTNGIEAKDLEQLDHARLRALFSRDGSEPVPSSLDVVERARALAESVLGQVERPVMDGVSCVYDLMIDARRIRCHAIERACEIFISLLERIPVRDGDIEVTAPETVVDAMYFTSGLLQEICERFARELVQDPNSETVRSRDAFYRVLLSLYQTPGQPFDGVTCFVQQQVAMILNELQLVWVSTATPTSTEYYCGLIRRLLRIATACELGDVRRQLIAHLDEIPQQDFVNTENRMMQRQCMRLMRVVRESCPQPSIMPVSAQVLTFFRKMTAALNQLLSSSDADDLRTLSAEVTCIEKRMSILGMMTDFPPVMAFIYELHHLAFAPDISRADIEDIQYWMITAANNICPEWSKPNRTELDFVRLPFPLPMNLFQQMLDSVNVIYDAMQPYASEEPVAWENVSLLRRSFENIVGYLPYSLQIIVQNAQNRCRYLKKNIYIHLDTSGYPKESEIEDSAVPPVIFAAFCTIISKLLETIIDCGFLSTDYNSRIDVVLQPFAHEVSAAIFHNGRLFSFKEVCERLEKVSIIPAADDNIFDLLVSSRRLAVTYPPNSNLAYILPILRQFNGTLEMSDDENGNTRLYLKFDI